MLDTQVQKLMSVAMAERTIELLWLRTGKDLCEAEKLGLSATYCSIFAEPPYNEFFKESEVRDDFTRMIEAKGFVFAAKKANRIVAFAASIPLDRKDSVVNVVKPYVDTDTACYFAEDAVVPDLRRRGISRDMKRLLLTSNALAGYKTMVLRTSIASDAQTAAVRQLGAEQIDGLVQDVDSVKKGGEVKPDRRVFFKFKLADFAKA